MRGYWGCYEQEHSASKTKQALSRYKVLTIKRIYEITVDGESGGESGGGCDGGWVLDVWMCGWATRAVRVEWNQLHPKL